MTKICRHCRRSLEVTRFSRNGLTRDHLASWCRDCNTEYQRKKRGNRKRILLTPQERVVKAREAQRLKNYGVSRYDFTEMMARQKCRCAICRTSLVPDSKDVHVDHDHQTKKVRGLLCQRCNLAIGLFRDSPKIMNAAIRYLRKSTKENLPARSLTLVLPFPRVDKTYAIR